ncbi:hypothetical protein HPP92_026068 [Vanilla planifolia]|uniref:Uncharacterized protein n=1 Tax=Vanilla planifolia TaxID=51239 RepID=A0A835U8G8_VANPL|nr:hypothetical protein HPP92_026340 [Vanilla planifolia]KAG0451810.1 hypothetical protein HPP92_026068 [Vanilla planifolia]
MAFLKGVVHVAIALLFVLVLLMVGDDEVRRATAIRTSGEDWVIIRSSPGFVYESKPKGIGPSSGPSNCHHGPGGGPGVCPPIPRVKSLK